MNGLLIDGVISRCRAIFIAYKGLFDLTAIALSGKSRHFEPSVIIDVLCSDICPEDLCYTESGSSHTLFSPPAYDKSNRGRYCTYVLTYQMYYST